MLGAEEEFQQDTSLSHSVNDFTCYFSGFPDCGLWCVSAESSHRKVPSMRVQCLRLAHSSRLMVKRMTETRMCECAVILSAISALHADETCIRLLSFLMIITFSPVILERDERKLTMIFAASCRCREKICREQKTQSSPPPPLFPCSPTPSLSDCSL